jgi:hypothetical protein
MANETQPPPDELDGPNELPDPVENAIVPTGNTSLADNGFQVDEYHQEVANRQHVRQKVFVKWDTTAGLFKVGDDPIAGYPGNEDLFCTIHAAVFSYQYWLPNMGGVGCENPNPGKFPFGNWKSGDKTIEKLCNTCEKNPRNGAKGDSCKDALNIVLSICLNGTEKMAAISTSNFKVVSDFNMFLDKLKDIGVHLHDSTIKIGKGDPIEVNKKKMFGWKLQVVAAKKPLHVYLREQAAAKKA